MTEKSGIKGLSVLNSFCLDAFSISKDSNASSISFGIFYLVRLAFRIRTAAGVLGWNNAY